MYQMVNETLEKEQENQQADQQPRRNAVDTVNDLMRAAKNARRLRELGAAGHAAAGLYGGTSAAGGAAAGAGAASGAAATGGAAAAGTAAGAGGASAGVATAATPVGWIAAGIGIIILLVLIIFFFHPSNIALTGSNKNLSNRQGGENLTYYKNSWLDYAIPFRNPSVNVSNPDAKELVKNEFPSAQFQYWDNIISESVKNNWNPAFALTLWIEETGASQHTKISMGGGGFSPISNGHLGCAPWEDQTINESLACLFKNFSNYDNSQFESFMRVYSGENPMGPFVNNPNFPARIKKYYSILVPSGYGAVTQVNNNQAFGNITCPLPNGKITCGSYGKPEPWGGFETICAPDSTGNGGHCNANYSAYTGGICQPLTLNGNLKRTAKSIDVVSPGGSYSGEPVYLPLIDGESVKWTYKGAVPAGGSYGWIRLFQSEPTIKGIWSIQLVHVNQDSPSLTGGDSYPSGSVGATLFDQKNNTHLHITIGANVNDSSSNLQDYSPQWNFTDRDIRMCTQ